MTGEPVAVRPRQTGVMGRRVLSSLLPFALVGCGAAGPPAGSPAQRFEAVALVLESPAHGPELCVGGVAQSLPPQCGGVPVRNWDWVAVEAVESRNGTTWGGDYRVVGTYDGTTFTLTEPAEPAPPRRPVDRLGSACADPSADASPVAASRVDKAALMAAMGRAVRAPDHAGLWVAGDDGSLDAGRPLPDGFVLNVAVTGDPGRREAELREVWGGRLCVVQHRKTLVELRRIQDELGDVAPSLGLRLTGTGSDESRGVVSMSVVTVTPEQQSRLDERYGSGVVEVAPALTALP